MERRRRLLLTLLAGGGLTPAQLFNAYVATLAPLLELRMNIPSGTNIPNFGSLGSAQDGTASNLTLGQNSPLGAGEAASWNGTTSFVSVPNTVSLDGIANFTYCFLHNQTGGGEGGNGRLFNWGNGNTSANTSGTGGLNAVVTNGAQSFKAAYISTSVWRWTFITHDNSDKKVRLYTGIAGSATEATGYGVQTAGVGNPTAVTGSLYLGNRLANDTTYDGLFSRFIVFNRLLSLPEMSALTVAAGLT